MKNDSLFRNLLDDCAQSVKKYRDNDKYPEYALYNDRYDRLLKHIQDIKSSALKGTLFKGYWSLEIMKMIIENDPDEIYQNVLKVDRYYCENYRDMHEVRKCKDK